MPFVEIQNLPQSTDIEDMSVYQHLRCIIHVIVIPENRLPQRDLFVEFESGLLVANKRDTGTSLGPSERCVIYLLDSSHHKNLSCPNRKRNVVKDATRKTLLIQLHFRCSRYAVAFLCWFNLPHKNTMSRTSRLCLKRHSTTITTTSAW